MLVEHVIKAITGAAHRVIVLDAGRKLAHGSVDDIVRNPEVIEAYLGSPSCCGSTGPEVAYGDLQVVWGVSFEVPKRSRS